MPFLTRLRIERVTADVRIGEQLDLHGGDVVIAFATGLVNISMEMQDPLG